MHCEKPTCVGACVAACPVGALNFDLKHEVIKEAHRRVHRRKGPSYIMGLKEAGGTDILTILPAKPQDMGIITAPKKVINQNPDKLRITAAGFMGASALSGIMYGYGRITQDRDKKRQDGDS